MRFLSHHRSHFSVLLILILAATVTAAEPQRVDNGAEPAEGLVTARMVEQWRAGGEDDEVFFGNVGRIIMDAEGNLLLLDTQLSEIQVYDGDGNHLRTIGREGDGPGEMRRPNDCFIMGDGAICVLQGFGGRITKLDGEGLPAGDASYAPISGSGQFSVMIRGLAAGDDMLLAGIKLAFTGNTSEQTYFLTRCDATGKELGTIIEKKNTIDYSDFVLTEGGMDFVWGRMAVGPDGTVHVVPARNEFAVHSWAPDGTERIITRPYEPVSRNDEQKDVARKIVEGIGTNYPTPPREIGIEDYEADVTGMWAHADGTLWIQTSRGDAEHPDGTWTMLDVYDTDGKFVRQVALAGDHDPLRDGLHMLPDGRFVVVTGALDAFLSQQAVGGEEAAEEAEPLEIICYTLEM